MSATRHTVVRQTVIALLLLVAPAAAMAAAPSSGPPPLLTLDDYDWTCPDRTCDESSCIVSTTEPSENNRSAAYPNAPTVTMGMYNQMPEEEGKKAGDPDAMVLGYDLNQDCFGWSRTVDDATAGNLSKYECQRDNSASCFICYRDALCFREFTGTLTCNTQDPWGAMAINSTDKLFVFDKAQSDGGGNAYTRLIEKNKDCPARPKGYDIHSCAEELALTCDRKMQWTLQDPDAE
ncbi:MAG: hypothetical protein ACI8PZ_001364 [Myxococcota bacterium]|jgi:hypothetical protein